MIHQSATILQRVASQASTPQMFVDVVRFVFRPVLLLTLIFMYLLISLAQLPIIIAMF